MKKLSLILLFVLLAVGMVMAQAAKPSSDVLGAHNNGGRGCAGCHAPHSGAAGGDSTIAGGGVKFESVGNTGDWHLWGTDLSAITQETLQFGLGYAIYEGTTYTVNFGGAQQWTIASGPLIGGVAVCLSCHDGNVSKGAMMTGYSYEQAAGLLPNGAGLYGTTGALYNTGKSIPTWLGNDGGTVGDYLNDHPVGPNANYNALAYPYTNNTTTNGLGFFGLTYTLGTTGGIIWGTPTGAYAQFVTDYGAPAVNAMVNDSVNTVPYVVCTTCHNQHQMNIYAAAGVNPSNPTSAPLSEIQGNATGTYTSYFFVNSPYNPGSAWGPMLAPSTTQFCRQCHMGESNEFFGATNIGTAF